ncbi:MULTISPECIES: aminotransferase class V-fold PLP-dependent enzyme [unclassified Fusibacter]|uniref:aminotransferase class V-fold PLP-dependent enzyme n=1 Tax=unclassified Fusibacter TaxID=2624464 RepID=UPI001013377A|nr:MULTISPECIES: aminotransferase class V-fold PLP-dependent enzyme [unclassified Fusibacter]MCK8058925.1 aminotransferase class V-fold PLP-dependent enzyme [Fusibacter sp. A2]NPE22000.1 aminotransferase class V-fold PLP-dependent enzyme [Fusibacter sp. A1]RXV61565.1 aminotransferase class V-fold PLP-dependent enzyme [Fusibacter sp. A1]
MDFNFLRNETIGYGSTIQTPFGTRLMTYADYTASGKQLRFIENYILHLSEHYANSHTEDSYTGRRTTEYYHQAKEKMHQYLGANENYSILPVGTGATAAIDKLSRILGIYETPELLKQTKKELCSSNMPAYACDKPVVFISSYEHHSNELQWRLGYAEVVKIELTDEGLFDLNDLEHKLNLPVYKHRKKIGSFSAASNVTGIKTPVYEVARLMHLHGGLVFFDFAASGPYVEINMTRDENSYFDGIYLSLHKFLGGPGSSGLLVINNAVYPSKNIPTIAGGGTVTFVTEDDQCFVDSYEDREDAGTPGIFQVIRGALCLEVKHRLGQQAISDREHALTRKGMEQLTTVPSIQVLGNLDPENRVGIVSFVVKYKEAYLHHGFITTLINDLFGIQLRAGCTCAGPYGIKLLNIDDEHATKYKKAIMDGVHSMKPGWVRVNFHYTYDDETFNYIIKAILFAAENAYLFLSDYEVDTLKGTWAKKGVAPQTKTLDIDHALVMDRLTLTSLDKNYSDLYEQYLQEANLMKEERLAKPIDHELFAAKTMSDIAWFYHSK